MASKDNNRLATRGEKISLRGRRVLVTGARGFIGKYLLEALQSRHALVTVLDRIADSPGPSVQQWTGDLRDIAFVRDCVVKARPEIVFHLAAFKERTSELAAFGDAISINLLGSLNLLTAIHEENSAKSIVVVGTAEEYGGNASPFIEGIREAPISAYSFSKACTTQLCELLYRLYKLPLVVVRPTIVYGPGQKSDMFLPALIESLLSGRTFPMTGGAQTRDFLYITDLVDGLLCAATSANVQGQVLNLGSGRAVLIADLALSIQRMLGKSELVRLGALPYRPGEVMAYSVDIKKASQLLDWQPIVQLEGGLAQTIRHYRSDLQ